jgi:hypothetical protein
MRKLTVLLLAGAFLAITGGASGARAEDFAILTCGMRGPFVEVIRTDISFDIPEVCMPAPEKSCSKCVDAITEGGNLKLVDVFVDPDILMIFSRKKGVLKR